MSARLLSLWLWLAFATLLTSCASTSVVNQWQSASYRGGPFGKVLVIGISDQEGMRRTFEDVFTQQLRERGVGAAPGYSVLPTVGKMDERALLQAVRNSNADGVLISRVVQVDNQTYHAPGYWWPNVGFYGYYAPVGAYYQLSRLEQFKVVTVESNLWDLKDEFLVWSGTTRTFRPGAARKEAAVLARDIIAELEKSGLIVAREPSKGG